MTHWRSVSFYAIDCLVPLESHDADFGSGGDADAAGGGGSGGSGGI